MKRKHSKLPWVFVGLGDHDYCIVEKGSTAHKYSSGEGTENRPEINYFDPKQAKLNSNDGGVVGSSEWIWLSENDAKFIVTAVNSHYELVEACKEAFKNIDSQLKINGGLPVGFQYCYSQLQNALSKATGEKNV